MKLMDKLGNELHPGDVAYFGPLQTIVVVLEVIEPGKVADTPGCVTIGIKTPFKLEKGKTDAIFNDLIRVHTPDEGIKVEQQVEDILSGKTKPSHTLEMPTKRQKGA